MFIGEYNASVTAGNRIAIPKNYREALGGEPLIVTKGYEGAIVLIQKHNFMQLLEGVTDMPFISADKRETSRFLLSGAHEVRADKQGRIILPESLIAHAGVSSENVTFIGVGNWIEIWDQKHWNEYEATLQEQSIEIAERLNTLNRPV